MNKLIEIFSQSPAIKAFGMSLLHSLWQAAAIAFMLWMITKLLKNFQAQVRYSMAILALLLLSSAFFITFFLNYQAHSVPQEIKTVEVFNFGELDEQGAPLANKSFLQLLEEECLTSLYWLKNQIPIFLYSGA